MVMVCKETIHQYNKDGSFHADGFYLHQTLKDNLDYEHKRIQSNWDCCSVVTGEEGSGKSNMGKAICYYVASLSGIKFSVNDIVFTVQQFEKWLETAPPGSACLWDEFVLAGASQDALLPIQNVLIKKMTLIRKRRLFIMLVLPYIFMLRKYFAVARTRFLIHVTSPDNLTRGTFDYYSKPSKRKLYILGFKFWEYNAWDCDFHGNFSDYTGILIDEVEYEKKKDDVTNTFNDKTDYKNSPAANKFGLICKRLVEAGIGIEKLVVLCETSRDNIIEYIKRFDEANPDYNIKPRHNEEKRQLIINAAKERVNFLTDETGTLPMPKRFFFSRRDENKELMRDSGVEGIEHR